MYRKIFLSLLMVFFTQTLWADSTSNIIVNGDFSTESDWWMGKDHTYTNWSISDGKVVTSGVIPDGEVEWSFFENNSSFLKEGQTYRITFDIDACSDFDRVGFFIQSTHPGDPEENSQLYFSEMGITTTGRFSIELTLLSGAYPFRLLNHGEGATATIDNISVVQIPSFTITPKEFLFGTTGGQKIFNLIYTAGSREIRLPAAILQVSQAGSFNITSDTCSNKKVSTNYECNITVGYPALTDISLSAYLNFGNVTAFLHNHESTSEEVARRLPPVIDDLNISEVMDAGTDYNLTWSIVGYGDDYTSYVAFFDCNNTAEGSCGESYGSAQRFDEGLNLTPYLTESAGWTYQGEEAKRYHYSYDFTPQAEEFGSGDTPIVIRFYYVDGKDLEVGQGSISLMIPGNLSENYYDTSGRKIQKIISK